MNNLVIDKTPHDHIPQMVTKYPQAKHLFWYYNQWFLICSKKNTHTFIIQLSCPLCCVQNQVTLKH